MYRKYIAIKLKLELKIYCNYLEQTLLLFGFSIRWRKNRSKRSNQAWNKFDFYSLLFSPKTNGRQAAARSRTGSQPASQASSRLVPAFTLTSAYITLYYLLAANKSSLQTAFLPFSPLFMCVCPELQKKEEEMLQLLPLTGQDQTDRQTDGSEKDTSWEQA